MIPDQTIVSYTGTWSSTFTQTPDAVINSVSANLGNDQLPVKQQSNNAGFFNAALEQPFQVTLQLQIDNGLGFNSVDDIIAIVRHEVFIVTGKYPTADSIPYVQQPGGSQQGTGQPQPTGGSGGSQSGCIAGTSNDLTGSFSLSCWFGNLTSKGLSTVGFLALLALLGLGLFVYAETKVERATGL